MIDEQESHNTPNRSKRSSRRSSSYKIAGDVSKLNLFDTNETYIKVEKLSSDKKHKKQIVDSYAEESSLIPPYGQYNQNTAKSIQKHKEVQTNDINFELNSVSVQTEPERSKVGELGKNFLFRSQYFSSFQMNKMKDFRAKDD